MKYKEKNFNLPRILDISDYNDCVELVKKNAESNNSIRALYLMGGEWKPGISDLDIVVIYKNFTSPIYLASPWSLGDKAKFIFTHRYLSFDESTAKNFYFLYPKEISNLRLILGTPFDFVISSPQDEKWTLAFIIFDVLVNKLLLFPKFKIGQCNIRNLLGELYSLIYTINVVEIVTGKKIGGNFANDIKSLKKDWFNMPEDIAINKLLLLLDSGIEVVMETVKALDNFLIDNKVKMDKDIFFINDKYRIFFSKDWNRDSFLKEFGRSLITKLPFFNKKIESFRMVLPESFSFFFLAYRDGDGKFSKMIRKHLIKCQEIQMSIPIGVSNHIKAMNGGFKASIDTNGNFKIPFSFGFSFIKSNFKNRLFWMVVSLFRFLNQ